MTAVLETLRTAGQRVGLTTAPPPEVEAKPETFTLFVAYNGVEKIIAVRPEEPVRALLQEAIKEFHVTSQPHLLSLHTEAGVELADTARVADAGVKPDSHVLLRPSAVKGGDR